MLVACRDVQPPYRLASPWKAASHTYRMHDTCLNTICLIKTMYRAVLGKMPDSSTAVIHAWPPCVCLQDREAVRKQNATLQDPHTSHFKLTQHALVQSGGRILNPLEITQQEEEAKKLLQRQELERQQQLAQQQQAQAAAQAAAQQQAQAQAAAQQQMAQQQAQAQAQAAAQQQQQMQMQQQMQQQLQQQQAGGAAAVGAPGTAMAAGVMQQQMQPNGMQQMTAQQQAVAAAQAQAQAQQQMAAAMAAQGVQGMGAQQAAVQQQQQQQSAAGMPQQGEVSLCCWHVSRYNMLRSYAFMRGLRKGTFTALAWSMSWRQSLQHACRGVSQLVANAQGMTTCKS